MVAPPAGACSPLSRRSKLAANSGLGSTGTTGRRRASSGSGIMALPLFVDAAERDPGPDQERLGGVKAAAERPGDLGDRQAVQVAQRQRRAVMRRQPGQGGVGG